MGPSLVSPVGVVGFDCFDLEAELAAERLVTCIALDSSWLIGVAGPLAGAAMSALRRRGFSRIEAARRVTRSHRVAQKDLLFILGCKTVNCATDTVTSVLPDLRDGGILAVDTGLFAHSDERPALCRRLAHRGLRYPKEAFTATAVIALKPGAEDL